MPVLKRFDLFILETTLPQCDGSQDKEQSQNPALALEPTDSVSNAHPSHTGTLTLALAFVVSDPSTEHVRII
jgi:hypothetical protein